MELEATNTNNTTTGDNVNARKSFKAKNQAELMNIVNKNSKVNELSLELRGEQCQKDIENINKQLGKIKQIQNLKLALEDIYYQNINLNTLFKTIGAMHTLRILSIDNPKFDYVNLLTQKVYFKQLKLSISNLLRLKELNMNIQNDNSYNISLKYIFDTMKQCNNLTFVSFKLSGAQYSYYDTESLFKSILTMSHVKSIIIDLADSQIKAKPLQHFMTKLVRLKYLKNYKFYCQQRYYSQVELLKLKKTLLLLGSFNQLSTKLTINYKYRYNNGNHQFDQSSMEFKIYEQQIIVHEFELPSDWRGDRIAEDENYKFHLIEPSWLRNGQELDFRAGQDRICNVKCDKLGETLARLNSVTSLNISNISKKQREAACEWLVRFAIQLTALTKLDLNLNLNRMWFGDYQQVVNALNKLTTLTTLSRLHLHLTVDGINKKVQEYLAKLFSRVNILNTLSLRFKLDTINETGCKQLAESLNKIRTLHQFEIDIQSELKNDEHFDKLKSSFEHFDGLTKLSLNVNSDKCSQKDGISHRGQANIGCLLKRMTSLTRLDLNLKQCMKQIGYFWLVLESFRHLNDLTSLDLNLSRNELGDQCLGKLAEALLCLNRISQISLDLRDNNIGAEGFKQLSYPLKHQSNLSNLHLNLSGNYINYKVYQQLAKMLAQLNRLRNLSLNLSPIQRDEKDIHQKFKPLQNVNDKTFNYNTISIKAYNQLVKSLTQIDTLRILCLNFKGAQLSTRAVQQLARRLNKLTELQQLNLNLSFNPFNSESLMQLLRSISKLSDIIQFELNLKGCNVKYTTGQNSCWPFDSFKKYAIIQLILDQNQIEHNIEGEEERSNVRLLTNNLW